MENLPHSRQPNMISKKSCNGSATSTKSIYDDVFGGPPKFGAPTLSPRVEDYSEIFGGFHSSRASSIPVLDLPLVDNEDVEVFFDVRSSGSDYSEVFGGFDGHDFAVSYEELMTMEQSNGHDDSSDEAWTPAEAENLSEESDHSAKDQCLSSGDSCESIDGCMEFNISYNKASKKCDEDMPNGMRHITQLHDVSGYTFVVDKSSSVPVTDHEYCYMQSRDDDNLNTDYSGELLSGRHLRKVVSHPANGGTGELLFGYNVAPHKEFVRNGSLPKEMFLSISDVSLRTQPSHLPPPSRPPPPLDGKMGMSDIATPNCKSVASEESAGDSSPPYFDVEVDAGSSASGSAAAMKEAMEKAQAKLKSAKESMERKQEGFQSCSKSGSSNDRRKKKEKVTKIDNCSGSKKDERRQGTVQRREENGMEYFISEELISDSLEGKHNVNVVKISSEENHGRESLSSQGSGRIDVAGEWKEATQFFELVTNKSKKAIDQENNENFSVRDSNFYECGEKQNMITVLGLQQHQEKKVEKAGADHKLEEYGKKSEVLIRAFKRDESFERLETANKQNGFDKKLQITQEASKEERNEKKFSRDWQPVETEKRRTRAYDVQKNLDSVEVQHKENRQTMKHMEKGLQWKEDNKSAGNVKKFTHEKEGSGIRQIKAFELEENEKFYVAFEPTKNEIRLKKAAQQGEKEKMIKAVYEWEENQKMQREDYDREENEKRLREAAQQEESERRLKEALEKEQNERRLKENHDKEDGLRIQREAAEQEEKEKRQNETREREENEKRQGELLEREANEKRLKEAQKEENERRLKENFEKEEWQRRQREVVEQEENAKREREQQNEKRLKEALEKEERQRREREAVEQEENAKKERAEIEKRLKKGLEKEERQRRQREAVEQKENAKREREANEKRLKEALEKEENERRQKEAVEQRNNEKKQREAHATKDVKQQRKTCEMEVSEIRFKEAFGKEEITEKIKDAHESEVQTRLEEVCEKPENTTTYRYFEEVKEFEPGLKEDHEPSSVGDMSQAKCKWEETEMKHMNASINGNQTGLYKTEEDYVELDQACMLNNNEIHGAQFAGKHENSRKMEATTEIACEETSKMLSEPGNGEMEAASGILHVDLEHDKRLVQVEEVTVTEQKANEKIKSSFRVDLDSGSQGMRFAYEMNERGKNVEQTHIFSNQEDNKVNLMSAGAVKEPIETGIRKKGAQPTALEVKGNNQRAAQQVNASQSAEQRVKNSYETLPPEEKESEETKRERDLEKERLRKMEEEWEREREREKDRMAVDRATLETRERAYAEVRERAERAAVERATAEARQRALNEARERLEKACAEARDKSLNDKATMEARIRAERAAVERATAEARERAFEKAMAERAAFEARERVERSVSDKFTPSSRNNGIRPSSLPSELQDMQSQGAGTFSGSRYQYSSVYSERTEGVEGESPQRCKARLERHRRTAERAAKALAEKNMRDLLAQREQAERNRLAETLDADVKRWSSGKEGNLRALLSTLQYILGPDSGWQSIPLTEVITAAAVKRAYRKATLCVHPDKLQQRGASIQQKYICEKVFDLLKEAWNKFNSEER